MSVFDVKQRLAMIERNIKAYDASRRAVADGASDAHSSAARWPTKEEREVQGRFTTDPFGNG